MREKEWDRLLQIDTAGRYDKLADDYVFPYEPTPYSVLERLLDSEYIGRDNTVIDYGSGRGRVSLFLSKIAGCRSIGIEFAKILHEKASENLRTAGMTDKVRFLLQRAEFFLPPKEADRCYFFNPFSEEILTRVLQNLTDSFYVYPREVLLFFYYPSAEYLETIRDFPELVFLDEISCADLFRGNNVRERVLIFTMR